MADDPDAAPPGDLWSATVDDHEGPDGPDDEPTETEPIEVDSLTLMPTSRVTATVPDGDPPVVEDRTATTLHDTGAWRPWVQARSTDSTICPFLRAIGDDDAIGFPVESPDAANRCAAMREPVPQSLRQQELVCLTSTHVNCPRYLRGTLVATGEVPPATVRTRSALTPAITASLVILALSFSASVAFGLANGGLVLPSGAIPPLPSAPEAAVASIPASTNPGGEPASTTAPTPTASLAPVATPTPVTPSATASPTPSTSPSPAPTPSPTPSEPPIATPTPEPTPDETETPKPTSARFKLLVACPGKSDCWIYTIRSGDNLFSISKYFGVSLSRVQALNPWTETKRLRAGQKLTIPTPTR